MGGEERPSARPLGIQLAMNQPGVCSVVSGSVMGDDPGLCMPPAFT